MELAIQIKKQKLILLLWVVVLIVSFSGCGSTPKSLSGVYVIEGGGALRGYITMLEFFSDGKYSSDCSNYHGEYSIDGNRIWMEGVLMEDLTYLFKIENGKLVFYYNEDDSSPDVFIKK